MIHCAACIMHDHTAVPPHLDIGNGESALSLEGARRQRSAVSSSPAYRQAAGTLVSALEHHLIPCSAARSRHYGDGYTSTRQRHDITATTYINVYWHLCGSGHVYLNFTRNGLPIGLTRESVTCRDETSFRRKKVIDTTQNSRPWQW